MSDSNILEIHNLKYKSKICNEISINSWKYRISGNFRYEPIFAFLWSLLQCKIFITQKFYLVLFVFREFQIAKKWHKSKKLNIFPIFANFITKKTDKRLLIQKVMASVVCLLHLVIDPEMFSATTQCESDLYQYVIRWPRFVGSEEKSLYIRSTLQYLSYYYFQFVS